MTIWIIEPRDPLIVRDGRPFGPDPGARAMSLPFPFPSTTAGGARTRAGLDSDGTFKYAGNKKQLDLLKQLRVRGPLLVPLTSDRNDIEQDKWLIPAPHDTSLFLAQPTAVGEATALIQQLVPLLLPKDAETDFNQEKLLLVGQSPYNQRTHNQRKPLDEAPRYWHWNIFQTWLHDPSQLDRTIQPLSKLGLGGPVELGLDGPVPVREQRLHVSIDADKEVAREGMLFLTSGLEFTLPGKGNQRLKDARRLALAIDVDDNKQFTPSAGFAGFGGERRIVTWHKSSVTLPSCPSTLEQAIIANKACRVFLLTPAYFEKGYYPTWLSNEAARCGVTAELKAIAIQRPQVASGWDFELGRPKPSRRLAPAGTVLFLSLKGSSETAMSDWIRKTWMQCISDDEQARTDGFGLAVLGTWSGQPVVMQEGQQS